MTNRRSGKPPPKRGAYAKCGCGNLAPRDMIHNNGPGYWCDDCWKRYRESLVEEKKK